MSDGPGASQRRAGPFFVVRLPSPALLAGEGQGEGFRKRFAASAYATAPERFPHPNPLPQVMRERGSARESGSRRGIFAGKIVRERNRAMLTT